MTIDHDAIAARVRQDNTLGLNICAAYLDLYDEVQRLRAERDALRSYPNAEGDSIKALTLRIQAIERHTSERNEALNLNAQQAQKIAKLKAERDALRAALGSIANNTCCGGCQEAALVARQALKGQTND